jgi:dihydroorotase
MNISEDDVRALRQEKDLGRFIRDEKRAAMTRNAHRRGLVLAHADLAAKLTEQPLNFSQPERWTGFIPPATLCTGALNTSPVRPALLALVYAAEQRQQKAVHPRRQTEAEETAA